MTFRHLLAAGAFALAASSAYAGPYSGLVVFGDSLVDAGNTQNLTGGLSPTPNQGYFQGRYTDGPDYTDLLNARITGIAGNYTVASRLGGDNYAYGGARVADNSGYRPQDRDIIPDLEDQVDAFIADTGGSADGDALYVITATGNDIFAAATNPQRINGATTAEYFTIVADTLATQLQRLYDAGARDILLTSVPNAATPALALQLQAAIDTRLSALAFDDTLLRFDLLGFFAQASSDPASLGLPPLDFTTSCRAARPLVNGVRDCTGIFSFDGTHPTAAVQAAVFRQVAQLVGVPEPGAVMLLAFGAVGVGAMRRRASRIAA